jgi:EcoRII C terminal
MNKGLLSEYFEGVAVKRLSAVDTDPKRSNQHEVGTTRDMRRFLGENHQQQFDVNYIWLGDEQDGIPCPDTATHYDSRLNQPNRSPEWRLYYSSNMVTEIMQEGDTLFLAKRPGNELLFVVVPAGSTIESQLLWLFSFDEQPDLKFTAQEYVGINDSTLDFAARFILDELGIEFEDPNANNIEAIVERFGLVFPKTVDFSDLARLTLPGVDARDDADQALLAWLNHEEAMFRQLEKKIVSERLRAGFVIAESVDVDGFLSFSLSVQNRRKSRMGLSFENHLSAVFRQHEIKFERGCVTERGNKPDFLFPAGRNYHDPLFPSEALTMLAAKSTCKDRWRQVLPEADRLPQKHLITLEPAISGAQTAQMEESNLQLVVPLSIQSSYTDGQREWLMSLKGFLGDVSRRQISN